MRYIKKEDLAISLRDLSGILQMLSVVMLVPIITTIYYPESYSPLNIFDKSLAFIIPSLILYLMYRVLKRIKTTEESRTRHIMITIALAWFIIGVVGALPFIIRGILTPVDSLFESMSGWTTTGFSMIREFESAPRDLLFYRGLTQGVGGLGVISLGLMVLLHGGRAGLGYVDMGVYKIKPGVKSTIRETWKIYLFYIVLGVVLLWIAGMSLFDAINHSMAAVATGGFSTHSDIGYYNNFWIEVVLIFLMLAGMTNFLIHYRVFNKDFKALRSSEVKYTLALILIAVAVISISVYGKDIPGVNTYSIADILRKTVFHVVAGMSTCGFNTVDFGKWPEIAQTTVILLMYVGGMAASTAGGIRVIRFVIIMKSIRYSVKKLVLPKTAVVSMKVDDNVVKESEVVYVLGYSAVYALSAIVGATLLMYLGYTTVQSLFTIISAMGNDGLGVVSGVIWYNMPTAGKLIVTFFMWIGRIEIYPFLLIVREFLVRAH